MRIKIDPLTIPIGVVSILILLGMFSFGQDSVVDDPFVHYLEHYDFMEKSEVLSFNVDITSDGQPDILMSSSHGIVDIFGVNAWAVYQKISSGYTALQMNVSLEVSTMRFVEKFPGIEKNVLCGNDSVGRSMAPVVFYFDGKRLRREFLEKLLNDQKDEAVRERMKEAFSKGIRVSILRSPIEQYADKYTVRLYKDPQQYYHEDMKPDEFTYLGPKAAERRQKAIDFYNASENAEKSVIPNDSDANTSKTKAMAQNVVPTTAQTRVSLVPAHVVSVTPVPTPDIQTSRNHEMNSTTFSPKTSEASASTSSIPQVSPRLDVSENDHSLPISLVIAVLCAGGVVALLIVLRTRKE